MQISPLTLLGTLFHKLGRKKTPGQKIEPRGFKFPEERMKKQKRELARLGYPQPFVRTEEKPNRGRGSIARVEPLPLVTDGGKTISLRYCLTPTCKIHIPFFDRFLKTFCQNLPHVEDLGLKFGGV